MSLCLLHCCAVANRIASKTLLRTFVFSCGFSRRTSLRHRLLLNHLKHVTGSRYAPWCFLDLAPLRRRLSWTSRSSPHSHSVEQLLEHLHPLFSLFCHSCHTELLRELFASACCWHCSSLFTGSWVPIPGCFVHGSSGPNPWLFLFPSRPLGTCFINQIQCQLLLRNHCCCSLHRTSSILTSRDSITHRPLVTIEVAIITHNWNRP